MGESSFSVFLSGDGANPEEDFVMSGEAFGGSGFRRTGEATDMRGVCARKAENEGTDIFTGKACLWRVEETVEGRQGSKGAPSCLKGSMARAQGLDKPIVHKTRRATTIIRKQRSGVDKVR